MDVCKVIEIDEMLSCKKKWNEKDEKQIFTNSQQHEE